MHTQLRLRQPQAYTYGWLMATNIINYAPEATPPATWTAAPSPVTFTKPLPQPLMMPTPAPAPAPAAGGLWGGHLKPAEIQIIVIGKLVCSLQGSPFAGVKSGAEWCR